jgi:hypothetical protein
MINLPPKQEASMTDIILTDVNGNKVVVDSSEITKNLSTIFGMGLDVIAELRQVYLKRGGRVLATVESVQEVFND